MAMADKLAADFEKRQSELAKAREERNRAQIDRIIQSGQPEGTGVLGNPYYDYSDATDETETISSDIEPTFKLPPRV